MTRRTRLGLVTTLALGVAGTALGLFLTPERTLGALLVWSAVLLGLGLAGCLGIAIQYAHRLPGAAAPLEVCERLTHALLPGAIGLLVVLVARPSIYSTADLHGFKAWWLTPSFRLARAVVYLAVWAGFAAALRNVSAARRAGSETLGLRHRRLAAVFFYVFGVTLTLSSIDWLMSLEPHWQSTIYGLYQFGSLASGGLAVITFLLARRQDVGERLRHDLGQLMMVFCCLWVYLWFSEFLLIWYTAIPEEATHFITRLQGNWQPLFYLNLALNGAVPFIALLPREWKSSAAVLQRLACLLFAGRWLDLHLLVVPSLQPHGAPLSPADLSPALLGLAVVLWLGQVARRGSGAGR